MEQRRIVIKDKQTYYRMANMLAFGNKNREYFNLKDVPEDIELWGIRQQRTRGGGIFLPNVKREDLSSTIDDLVKQGHDRRSLVVSERLPDDKILLNGEVMRGVKGLYLYYATSQKIMKKALTEDGQEAFGLKAKLILEHFLNPICYDELMEILDTYDNHVVEFTAYSTNIGVIPHRNTIIWEVRAY